jgi:hypothetical protein
MLAFRPAFDAKERGRLVREVTGGAPPPLRWLNPEVPRDLETIVQKAIERDPAHRYGTASALGDDLRRYLDDEPIRARRASHAERLARWCRRNPAVAALLGLVVVLLLGGLAASTAAAYRFNRLADRERRALLASRAAEHRARSEAARADAQAVEARKAAEGERRARAEAEAAQQTLGQELYDSRMNLVQSAFEARNLARGQVLLDAVRPRGGEPDRRGF